LEDPYTQATSGKRRFVVFKRTGGQVVLAEALKKIKISL
jgi:HK97 family phage major capsid protein